MHLWRKFDLPATGLILEIGGGGNPAPCSKVLVDYYIDQDQQSFRQRGGQPMVSDGRILIQADGAFLPFGDQQFDYVVLSHVIEHIPADRIEQFVNELGRVARAGYIEAPSVVYEAIRDIPEHIWYVACEAGVVHLCRKTDVSSLHPFLDSLFADGDFCAVVEKHAEVFFTGLEWRSRPALQVHTDLRELMNLYPPDWARREVRDTLAREAGEGQQARNKQLLKKLLPPVVCDVARAAANKLIRHGMRKPLPVPTAFPVDWRQLVVCPQCHADLVIDLARGKMECKSCQGSYHIRPDGVPSFIAPDETP